jgi:hypothetical protein
VAGTKLTSAKTASSRSDRNHIISHKKKIMISTKSLSYHPSFNSIASAKEGFIPLQTQGFCAAADPLIVVSPSLATSVRRPKVRRSTQQLEKIIGQAIAVVEEANQELGLSSSFHHGIKIAATDNSENNELVHIVETKVPNNRNCRDSKMVSFSNCVDTRETLSRGDYSCDELVQCWWTPEEHERTLKQARHVVQLLKTKHSKFLSQTLHQSYGMIHDMVSSSSLSCNLELPLKITTVDTDEMESILQDSSFTLLCDPIRRWCHQATVRRGLESAVMVTFPKKYNHKDMDHHQYYQNRQQHQQQYRQAVLKYQENIQCRQRTKERSDQSDNEIANLISPMSLISRLYARMMGEADEFCVTHD